MERIHHVLRGDSPGKSIELNGFRFGDSDAPHKVYLQAALHADEQPGILLLSHLIPLLQQAEDRGHLAATFVVFPMVNPVGMQNIEYGIHQGRFDVASGVNFNRDWPDLYAAIGHDIGDHLGQCGETNTLQIRQAIRNWLQQQPAHDLSQRHRQLIMLEACDADYVFDIHCDNEAIAYIFCSPHCADAMGSLAGWLGAGAVLTAEDSGGGSFDEIWTLPFSRAQQDFPGLPIDNPVVSCTLEMRGRYDVFDGVAERDSRALMSFFQERGLVAEDPTGKPSPAPAPTPLNATELLRVRQAGLLAYQVNLGDTVRKGEVVAELLLLDGPDAFTRRIQITAGTSGRIISRSEYKYVWPGCCIAKIVCNEPLTSQDGYLLSD